MRVIAAQVKLFNRLATAGFCLWLLSLAPSPLALVFREHAWRSGNMTAWLTLESCSAGVGLIMLITARRPIISPLLTDSSTCWCKLAQRMKRIAARPASGRIFDTVFPQLSAAVSETRNSARLEIALKGERSRQAILITLHALGWGASAFLFVLCRGFRLFAG